MPQGSFAPHRTPDPLALGGNGEPNPERQNREPDRDNDYIACDREVKRFAKRLCKVFAGDIGSDARTFKKRVIEILRRHLPPLAGRPTEESITMAATLRGQGREWQEVYRLVISGHSDLDPATRRQMESNLRSAIRSRRNARNKRRKARRKLIAETSHEQDISLSGNLPLVLTSTHGAAPKDPHTPTSPIPKG